MTSNQRIDRGGWIGRCWRVLISAAGLMFGLWAVPLASAELTSRVDSETGLQGWTWDNAGMHLQLTQLLPDQARAFYQGRGFSAAESERIAGACVFQTVLRNTTPDDAVLEVALADWRVRRTGHAATPPRTIEVWLSGWGTPPLGQAQAIALRWALFPAEQRFAPGDWNMGMLTVDVPHGDRFDLEVRWRLGERASAATLPNLRCAVERP